MSANERQRQRHPAKFKAKLIADLLEGKVGVGALAQRNGLSPGMLHRWRREAVQRIRQEAESADPPPLKQSERIQQLESKLAERDLELDFFVHAFGKLGRPNAK